MRYFILISSLSTLTLTLKISCSAHVISSLKFVWHRTIYSEHDDTDINAEYSQSFFFLLGDLDFDLIDTHMTLGHYIK